MQEFSSVTASSYDAESLAPMLNDKAADGWSVVSIVAAGTNIVAYLQREAGEHADTAAPAAEEVLVAESMQDAPADETPADETPDDESPFIPAAEETPAPVEEPAGWAAAPDEQTTETPIETPVEEASIAELAAQVSEPEPEPAPEPVAEPAAEAAPAVESAVPAGWYADPSGRFELRYWDGTAWTEHVSRAGQQFTDPPVA
jgi:hypothetical protein